MASQTWPPGCEEKAAILSREKTPNNDAMPVEEPGGRPGREFEAAGRARGAHEGGEARGAAGGGQAGGGTGGLAGGRSEEEWLEIYEDRIGDAKERARSEIKLNQWAQYKFCDLDLDKVLGPPADNLPRVHCDDMSPAEFVERFEATCLPCIIQGCMDKWPAMKTWTPQWLRENFKDCKLKCGEDDDGDKVKLRMKHFIRYMELQQDDAPLYTFDADYGDAGKETRVMLDDFDVPEYFREDLFQYAGEDDRPPYRWFLAGPKRSGSSIHIDPLATSAWNAVISGRKRWVLFPPGTPKSAIKPSRWLDRPDHEAIDWFLYEFEGIKKSLPAHQQPLELYQYPGEIIFVPGGWWHTVLNVEDSIAITQNFCSTACFPAVWLDTRKSRTKLARRWLRALKGIRPDLYDITRNVAGDGSGTISPEDDLEELLEEKRRRKEKKKEKKRQDKESRKRKERSSM